MHDTCMVVLVNVTLFVWVYMQIVSKFNNKPLAFTAALCMTKFVKAESLKLVHQLYFCE